MARYINADDLPVTTVAIQPYALLEKPYNAEVVFAQAIKAAPTADVMAFADDERELIQAYMDAVEAIDLKTAILNAVSVALDALDWQDAGAHMQHWIQTSEQLPSDKGVCPATSTDCESVSEDLCFHMRIFAYGPSGSKSDIPLPALTEIFEEMPYD